jgi:antitoxin component YwqK of YwqJK toxin-antitoxin module
MVFSLSSFSQKITLSDLLAMGNKQNWESVNTYLSSKGWDYYDSKKGDSFKQSEIIWSYNKDNYNDQAQAWFHLYTYDEFPNQIAYSVFNKPSYEIILKSLSGAGFKLLENEIEDNSIVNIYSNTKFFLKVITAKREDNTYSNSSTTAYNFILIKKGGFYDKDNGKRYEYYDSGSIKTEFNLKDGLIEGLFNVYHENGKLKKTGNFSNGLANGRFMEYDESGFLSATYKMENGNINGLMTIYENNLISQEVEKQNNINNGKFVDYYYDDDNTLIMKIVGGFVQNKKNGKWESFIISDGKEELNSYTNYSNDVEDGDFMEYNDIGDTLEIGSYSNGKLHGKYSRKTLQQVLISEGFEEMPIWVIESEGQYSFGLKEGKWTEYYYGMKEEEGNYKKGLKTGVWNEYLTMGSKFGEIKSTFEYVDGKKNGLSKTYYFVKLSPTPIDGSNILSVITTPVLETTNYKNDLKNGDYSLRDSTGKLLLKGSYNNDQMNSTWTHYFSNNYSTSTEYKNGETIKVSYFDDETQLFLVEAFLKNILSKCDYYVNNKLSEIHTLQSQKDGYLVNVDLFIHGTQDTIVRTGYKVNSTEQYTYGLFQKYGIKDGDFQLLVNNQKIVEGKYCNNIRCGNWVFDHLLEQIYIVRSFRKDTIEEERYFDNKTKELYSGRLNLIENGNKMEIKIKKGLRNGKSLTYNKNGKLILEENYKEGKKVEK